MFSTPYPLANVSRETKERLETFVNLLTAWNRSTKLVSGSDLARVIERHIADSLALLPLLGSSRTIGDLGSGAGFPGLILALTCNRPVTLIEADRRKAAFLREAVRITGATAEIYAGRIESIHTEFDLVTARAVAPLPILLTLVAPRLKPDGRCLFPKGRLYQDEVDRACLAWRFRLIEHPSLTSPEARILEISDIQKAAE